MCEMMVDRKSSRFLSNVFLIEDNLIIEEKVEDIMANWETA
jgi:hypothetical protein